MSGIEVRLFDFLETSHRPAKTPACDAQEPVQNEIPWDQQTKLPDGLPCKEPGSETNPLRSISKAARRYMPPPGVSWETSFVKDNGEIAVVYYGNRRCISCGRIFVNKFWKPGHAPLARCRDCRQRRREANATCTPAMVLQLVPATKRIKRETMVKKAARELWIPMTVAKRMLDGLTADGSVTETRVRRSRRSWNTYIERNIRAA